MAEDQQASGKKIIYICQSCKQSIQTDYHGWKPTIRCQMCGGVMRMQSLLSKKGDINLLVNRFTEVTGFGYNKQGKMVGISTKGKHVDPSETRFDLQNDPEGWVATGMKVKGKQKR